jgi:hypothetical protein
MRDAGYHGLGIMHVCIFIFGDGVFKIPYARIILISWKKEDVAQ